MIVIKTLFPRPFLVFCVQPGFDIVQIMFKLFFV